MKYFYKIAIICFVSFLVVTQSFAKDYILDAREVNRILVGNTVKITETKINKETRKKNAFRAYFSHSGVVHTDHPSGATSHYNWSLRDDGSLCLKNNMSRHGRASCGYLYSKANKTYTLYRVKRVKIKKGRVVAGRKGKLLLTITDIKKGEQLR